MILVKTFYAQNELRNYSYLIQDSESGDSWVIDPYEADPMIDYIKKNGLVLKGILNTHQHFDHIRGNSPLIDVFYAQVTKLSESYRIELSKTSFLESLATPGHTSDHEAFVWKYNEAPVALFSGDTLFNSGVGNCQRGGDVQSLYETTTYLMNSLPPETLLYPGHDYRRRNLEFALSVEPDNRQIQESISNLKGILTENLPAATLAEEKQVNPFFRLNSEEIRQNVLNTAKTEKEIFIELRHLRDQW